MTTTDEKFNSLIWAREFLYDLLDRNKTKVPLEIRREASMKLRHYPTVEDIKKARKLFAKKKNEI